MMHCRTKIYALLLLASFAAVLCEPCTTPYQAPGTCMRIRECRELMAYLMTRTIPWSQVVQNHIKNSVCPIMKDGKKTICCPKKLIPFGVEEVDSAPGSSPDRDDSDPNEY